MNLDNFVVRPRRRLVEKYAKPESWVSLPAEALTELSHEVAGLPSELAPENEEAKRFDLLALSLQLSLLRHEPGFARLCDRVKQIAGLLEEKATIPMVRVQMALIQDVQTDDWWQDVTVPMLEVMRRRLRCLLQLIDKRQRKPIYTDFEDLMGGEIDVDLPVSVRPSHVRTTRKILDERVVYGVAGPGCQRSGRSSRMRFCGHPSASLRSTSVRYGRGGTSY